MGGGVTIPSLEGGQNRLCCLSFFSVARFGFVLLQCYSLSTGPRVTWWTLLGSENICHASFLTPTSSLEVLPSATLNLFLLSLSFWLQKDGEQLSTPYFLLAPLKQTMFSCLKLELQSRSLHCGWRWCGLVFRMRGDRRSCHVLLVECKPM